MNVSVFGLGYVGSVSAATFADDGHTVIGVDVNPTKVEMLNAGHSPIVEPGLGELIESGVKAGRLRATTSASEAVAGSDVSLISVATPSRRNGSLDLSHLTRVCEQVGDALREKSAYHIVVIRSTVLPGTTHETVIPTIERTSAKRYGTDFGIAVNPEFLREGSAVRDIRHPPLTLVGHNHAADAAGTLALYEGIDAPVVTSSIRVAEMIKYASNAWHALKVCFGNEIGNMCKRLDVDSHDVMEIFCQDTKLNLSPYYLKPGFAFGGSCLPKDVRALEYRAKELDLELPVLQSLLRSNQLQIQQALDQILETGKKRIGLLGFSFKAGTDDLRESPIVQVVESLVGKGYELRVHDSNVEMSRILGANKRFLEEQVPYVPDILTPSLDDVLNWAEVLVVANANAEYATVPARLRPDQALIDLVRILPTANGTPGKYVGLCW